MIRVILLPFPSFRKSVACYSNYTLTQTMQFILRHQKSMGSDSYYRQRHVYLFWHKYKQAYIRLGMMCADELKLRDLSYDHEKASRFFQEVKEGHWRKPLWVGWDRLHASHRAALLQIGEVELIITRYIKWKHLGRYTIQRQLDLVCEWFDDEGFHGIADGNEVYTTDVNRILDAQGAPPLPDECHNPYTCWNWSEKPYGRLDVTPPNPNSWLVEDTLPDECVESCEVAVPVPLDWPSSVQLPSDSQRVRMPTRAWLGRALRAYDAGNE